MRSSIIVTVSVGLVSFSLTNLRAAESWSIDASTEWTQATAQSKAIAIHEGAIVLQGATEGLWTSTWHAWQRPVSLAEMVVEADIDLFDNKQIQTIVKGDTTPYTDQDGVPHDWYGRCMIAILDENRWIMALRSGVNHISWGKRDTIHLITSNNQGKTWSQLNRWFDGTPIKGMPYEDGDTHSEPGLFKMPNGDLILQFWRTDYSSGTKQLRSTDHGKTWTTDIDRIQVVGVTGAADDRAIGTQDYFVDPEHLSDVYMAYQYFHYNGNSGTLLAISRDNGKSYSFLSWIGPLAEEDKDPDSGATFEVGMEYVGNRKIVAVVRDGAADRRTWQAVSTNMGASFSPLIDISPQVHGGVSNGLWQRARLYKESNPYFQHHNPLNHAQGEGRLWGFGIHSNGGGYTRKPVVYWSDDNGKTWQGPELLHGPMFPGTDTGYGDLKRRTDNTFVATTYYRVPGPRVADVEQYTFGGERVQVMIEVDQDDDGAPDDRTSWREVYHGSHATALFGLSGSHWRLRLRFRSPTPDDMPKIRRLKIIPK